MGKIKPVGFQRVIFLFLWELLDGWGGYNRIFQKCKDLIFSTIS